MAGMQQQSPSYVLKVHTGQNLTKYKAIAYREHYWTACNLIDEVFLNIGSERMMELEIDWEGKDKDSYEKGIFRNNRGSTTNTYVMQLHERETRKNNANQTPDLAPSPNRLAWNNRSRNARNEGTKITNQGADNKTEFDMSEFPVLTSDKPLVEPKSPPTITRFTNQQQAAGLERNSRPVHRCDTTQDDATAVDTINGTTNEGGMYNGAYGPNYGGPTASNQPSIVASTVADSLTTFAMTISETIERSNARQLEAIERMEERAAARDEAREDRRERQDRTRDEMTMKMWSNLVDRMAQATPTPNSPAQPQSTVKAMCLSNMVHGSYSKSTCPNVRSTERSSRRLSTP